MSESVDTIKEMFNRIVRFYVDTEKPVIIITGYVQQTMNKKESDQVKAALEILERNQFGFIRITESFFDEF
jgi:hypothetical protein